MQLRFQHPLRSTTTLVLTLLTAVSILVFISSEFLGGSDDHPGAFFINWMGFAVALIAVFSGNAQEFGGAWRFGSLQWNVLLLLLFNVCAYSLNRTIPVFNESVPWLSGLLTVETIAFGTLILVRPHFRENWTSHLLVVVFTLSLWLNLYQTIYVMPHLPLAGMIFWFLGIPLLLFTPPLLLLFCVRMLRRFVQTTPAYWRTIAGTSAFVLIVLTVFTIRYHDVRQTISEQVHTDGSSPELPLWVRVSQRLPRNFVSERVLTAGFRFVQLELDNFGLDQVARNGGNLLHDPIIAVASALSGKIPLPRRDQAQLANAVYQTRHETEERLWSGDALVTDSIETTIQLFPEYGLAYTEIVTTVAAAHNPRVRRWQQEALYSFHLPEGAAVTSGALWLEDGLEYPSILTTKSLADSAYTTIVKRERRDPLLVQWEEGNRVSARVFPVRSDWARRFKIGFVAPLRREHGAFVYVRPRVQGPSALTAHETVRVVGYETKPRIDADLRMRETADGYVWSGGARPNWKITLPYRSPAPRAFVHEGFAYTLHEETDRAVRSRTVRSVYLDLNREWTRADYDATLDRFAGVRCFVWDEQWKLLTPTNRAAYFDALSTLEYSVFPLHCIPDPDVALVLTRSGGYGPVLRDLDGSLFKTNFEAWGNRLPGRAAVVHLGGNVPNPYWKMIREFRLVDFAELDRLDELTFQNGRVRLRVAAETENALTLPGSDLRLVKTPADQTRAQPGAPSHLARLYAYNETLRQIGPRYFRTTYLEEDLIELAQLGNVVTPVSSLLTLETPEDYARFGLKNEETGLKNSQVEDFAQNLAPPTLDLPNDAGGVPEPGEWLLIGLLAASAAWLFWRRFF